MNVSYIPPRFRTRLRAHFRMSALGGVAMTPSCSVWSDDEYWMPPFPIRQEYHQLMQADSETSEFRVGIGQPPRAVPAPGATLPKEGHW